MADEEVEQWGLGAYLPMAEGRIDIELLGEVGEDGEESGESGDPEAASDPDSDDSEVNPAFAEWIRNIASAERAAERFAAATGSLREDAKKRGAALLEADLDGMFRQLRRVEMDSVATIRRLRTQGSRAIKRSRPMGGADSNIPQMLGNQIGAFVAMARAAESTRADLTGQRLKLVGSGDAPIFDDGDELITFLTRAAAPNSAGEAP